MIKWNPMFFAYVFMECKMNSIAILLSYYAAENRFRY